MILVDTSVWIDHLRATNRGLVSLLDDGRVMMHPMVLGELACGNLRDRGEVLSLLRDLPGIATATDDEVLFFIEQRGLMGRGIGYIDAHLAAAAALAETALIWTIDRHLASVASDLGLAFQLPSPGSSLG